MKKNIRTAAFYIAVAMFTMFTSCSSDNANSIIDTGGSTIETPTMDEPNVDNVSVEITDSAKYTIEEMADRVFGKEGANSDTEKLRQQFVERAQQEEKQLQNEYGANNGMLYYSYSYKYKSTDVKGNPIELSSLVSWRSFAGISLSPNNLFLYEHFTVTKDDQAPTKTSNIIQMAVGNSLMIQPDYIGYGITKNEVHPYLNHDVTAINSIDALEAGYQTWKMKTNNKKMAKDWKMYVGGVSQGGSAALAVHKYLDTHMDLANKWHFAYSYCSSGAYSPTITMQGYYEQGSLTYPVAVLLTIKSMMVSYPDILGKWTEDDFYSEKYCNIKSIMDNMLNSKQYTTGDINKKLRELLGVKSSDPVSLKDILSESVLDMNSDIAKDFFKCLEKNDLTTGWTPVHEIHLHSSTIDKVVPYANAEKLIASFPGKVKEEMILENVDHSGACVDWILSLLNRKW